MSEMSSHSSVQGVSCAGLVASAGIALIGLLVGAALDALSETSRQQGSRPSRPRSTTSQQSPGQVEALPALEARRVQIEEKTLQQFQRRKLDPVKSLKASTLKGLEGSSYIVNQARIEPLIKDFITAPDLATAEKARSVLIDATREQHRNILEESLTVACQKAAVKVGFTTIQTMQGPLGTLRVIAQDAAGRALVSEVNSGDISSAPRIETEVVGVCDGSCVPLLDAFDQALEEEGVRSGPPARKHTGGVAELNAAREFLRNRVHRTPAPRFQPGAGDSTSNGSHNAARRAQQFNVKEVQKRR